MRFSLSGVITIALVGHSLADSPPLAPRDFRKYSANKRFYAISEVKLHRTQVFSSSKTGPIWEVPGYHQILFLSNTGYLVIGQPDGNLLPQDARPQDELLAFYSSGKLVRSVKIHDVFADISLLPKTASHLSWALGYGFDSQNRFYIITFDGRRVLFGKAGQLVQYGREHG